MTDLPLTACNDKINPVSGLPVILNVEGQRCVVIGGGRVACRRAKALRHAGANVVVIAPKIAPQILEGDIVTEHRPYRQGDLNGARLVVVATNIAHLNDLVAKDAQKAGALVNRTDDPPAGDISIPAHAHHGPITIAVDTGGISPTVAAAIRRQLSDSLDPDWLCLLEIVSPYRAAIQEQSSEPTRRQDQLRQLSSFEALATLKERGPEALHKLCQQITSKPTSTVAKKD